LSYDKNIQNNEYIPHKEHFLKHVNGLYFAIDFLNKIDVLQPMILSKIVNDNWIDEIKK